MICVFCLLGHVQSDQARHEAESRLDLQHPLRPRCQGELLYSRIICHVIYSMEKWWAQCYVDVITEEVHAKDPGLPDCSLLKAYTEATCQ